MGNADWGGGFATGIGAGANVAENNLQPLIRSLRNEIGVQHNARYRTEQDLLDYYAGFVAMKELRNQLATELAKFDPNNALLTPKAPNSTYVSSLLARVYENTHEVTRNTALGTDQELRAMCPLLAAEFDENQKKLAAERKKQEEARMKALEKEYLSEMKAAGGGGMFSRLLGSRPTGFPEFKDWLVQKGYVKQEGQDQDNGVEQKG